MQPLEWIVRGPASDASQVIYLSAHAAHTACLLNDPGLLHAAQKLHPLHWQNAGVGTLAENGEYMLLKRADGANCRTVGPSLALGCVPLACQVFEGVIGCFKLSSFLGALGCHDAAVLCGAVA